MPKICNIEFNEVNFDLLQQYLLENDEKRWPNLRRLTNLASVTTSSEKEYENLEPWIQWVSVHTGKTAKEHGVYRLGDISENTDLQIFEWAEQNGKSVGNISAMNASNRLKSPKYFIPDPWTRTETDGSLFSKGIYNALHQSVNDNSSGKLKITTVFILLLALVFRTKISNWYSYVSLAFGGLRGQKWKKALFLDLLLSDLHNKFAGASKPDFTSIFLNGLAHIQHHYYFNSKYYDGKLTNPEWYVSDGHDPIEDALDVYERIFNDHFRNFTDFEILITTGLRQVPYTSAKFYYRLKNHSNFLDNLNFNYSEVYPRMTRDFLVEFDCDEDCRYAQNILENIKINSKRVFNEIDNRGASLFVTLSYPDEIKPDDLISSGENTIGNAFDEFVFVAIKNGMHDSKGYSFSTNPSELFETLDGKHVLHINSYFKERLLA